MFQTALEHINLNSKKSIIIQQFQFSFCGKMTKRMLSARAGHHRTSQGFSGRHSDPRIFATKVETSSWRMAQFREIVSKTAVLAAGIAFFRSRGRLSLFLRLFFGRSLTASMFECHVRFERIFGILLKNLSKIVDIGSCRYINLCELNSLANTLKLKYKFGA